MATQFQDKLSDKPLDRMTKQDAVLALWRLRGVVKDSSLPGSVSPKDVLLPGGRVKAVIEAAERQLGVTGTPANRHPEQPADRRLASAGPDGVISDDLSAQG
jgi:hypothetical protein